MTTSQDSLTFRYSGFLQNVDIQIQGHEVADGYKVTCLAKLKLPILKKNFITWTLFSDKKIQWVQHSPVSEDTAQERLVKKEQFSPHATDPIGLFLKINRGEWTDKKVHLVIGAKEVVLDVLFEKDMIVIARPEKNQKLNIKMGPSGIQALEVPLPVIGNIRIPRV